MPTTQGEATARQNFLVQRNEITAGKPNIGAQPLLAVDVNTDGNGFSNIQRFIEHQPDGFNSVVGVALVGDEGQISGGFMPHYFMMKYRAERLAGYPFEVTVLPDGRIMRRYKLPEFGQRIKRIPFSALFGLEDDSAELLYGKLQQMSVESARSGNVGGNITEHYNYVRRGQEMPDLDTPQNAKVRVVGQDISGPVSIGIFRDFNFVGVVEVAPGDVVGDIEASIEALDGIDGVTATLIPSFAKSEGVAVLSSHPVNTGSVIALLLNEGDGLTAQDSSTKNIDGALVGAATWGESEYGPTVDFALTGSLDFNNPAAVRLVASMTLFARIKTTKAAIQHLWAKHGADPLKSYALNLDATGHLSLAISSDGTAANTTTVTAATAPVNDGQWHNVAATYDGSKVRLFVDGVKVREQAVNLFLNNTATDLWFGNYADGSAAAANFEGSADVLRVWNRALSPDHISVLQENPYTGFVVNDEEPRLEVNTGFELEFTNPANSMIEVEVFEGQNYEVQQIAFGTDGSGLPLVPGPYLEPDHILRYKARTYADLQSIKMGVTPAEGASGPDPEDAHIIRTSQAGSITFEAMANPSYHEDRQKAPASHVDGDMNIAGSITLPKDKNKRCEEIYSTDNKEGGCGVTPWYYRQAFKCGPWEVWFDLFSVRNAQPDFPVENNESQRQFPLRRQYNPNGSCIITVIHPAEIDEALA